MVWDGIEVGKSRAKESAANILGTTRIQSRLQLRLCTPNTKSILTTGPYEKINPGHMYEAEVYSFMKSTHSFSTKGNTSSNVRLDCSASCKIVNASYTHTEVFKSAPKRLVTRYRCRHSTTLHLDTKLRVYIGSYNT